MRAYDLTVTGSAVISGSVTASYYTGVFNGAVSSSAQIASNISGSFTTVSSSLASRLTSEEADADFIAASISGSWRGELSSSNMTVVGGGVSGSASSTGSFGHVVVGSGTGGSGDKLIKVASQGGGNSSIRLMEGTGHNGFSLLYDGDGNQFSIRGHDNSAGGSQWLMFERDTGAATFAGTLNSGVFTSTGNIVSTGANAKISGSSTSTGSFGALSLDGSPNVYGNEHGIGIGAPAPAHSLDIIDAGNNPQIQFSYGPNPTDYHNNIRADVGSARFHFDLIQAGTTYTPLTLGTNLVSGSSTSTGSFSVIRAGSGRNRFGNLAADIHQFTGSIHVSSSRGTVNKLGPGDFYFNTDANSTFKIFDAGTNAIGLYAAASDQIYFGSNNTWQLNFSADGTEINLNEGVSISGSATSTGSFGYLTINSAKPTIGVGTASPDIRTQLHLVSSDNLSILRMQDDDTNAYFNVEGGYISMGDDTGLTANNLNWAISNKRLGIGTASPDSPLHIYQNATNTHVNIQNDTKPWIIGVRDDASDALVFRQNAANLVTISHTTGNLEVLTANAKISGSSSSTGSFGTIYATEGSGPNIQIFNAGTRYQYMHQNALYFENAYGVVGTVAGTDLRLVTNSTIGMVMAGSGQHVTFPVANQKISGSATSTGSFGTIYATEGSGPNVQIFNGGTRYLNLHQNQLTFENAGGVIRTVGSRALVLQTNSTTAIAIDTSQNVGIGQGTPQSDNSSNTFLHIGDSSTGRSGLVLEDGENQWEIYNDGWLTFADGSTSVAYFMHTNNNNFIINASTAQNVGIGTATPSKKLHVEGDALVTGTLTAQEFHTEFVSASINYTSGSTKFGNSMDDEHQFTGSLQLSGSVGNESYIIGTNVGIGTTDPAMPLHIVNSSGGRMMLHRTSGDSSSILGAIMFGANDGDTNLAMIAGYADGAADAAHIRFETEATGGSIAERMRIQSGGDIVFSGANQKISGSSTSTGSFGNIYSAKDIHLGGSGNLGTPTTSHLITMGTTNRQWGMKATTSPDQLAIGELNGEALFLENDGDVRIGRHISASAASTASFGQVYVDKAVAVDSITFNTPHIPSTGSLAPMIEADSGNTSNAHLRFYTSEGSRAEKMVIRYNGQVGIGTTSPDGKLHIFTANTGASPHSGADELVLEGTSDMGMTFLSSTSGAGIINFGDSDDNDIGNIEYQHADNSMRFNVNAGRALTLSSSLDATFGGNVSGSSTSTGSFGAGYFDGNVGMGVSTTNGARLQLQGTSALNNTLHMGNYGVQSGRIASEGSLYINIDATDEDSGEGQAFYFGQGGFAGGEDTLMTILQTGNVGIGTTAPVTALDVHSTGTEVASVWGMADDGNVWVATRTAETQNNYGAYAFMVGSAAVDGVGSPNTTAYIASKVLNSGGTLKGDLGFYTNAGDSLGTAKMLIDETGKVGIGTTSPTTKLQVHGEISGSGTLALAPGGSGGAGKIWHQSNNYMYMQGGSGGLVIKDTASETAAVILTTNNVAVTGTTVEFVSAAANISGSSTSTGSFGRLHIMGSNRVGIGTTLPSIGIDLVTNTDDSNIRLSTHHATDSAHPNLIFRKSDGTAASPGNVADDEYLGDIEWHAYHTDGYDIGARIGAYVDGTPGNGDMPTRLVFSTSADASASPTARMTLLATGYVHMDGAADVRLTLGSEGTAGENSANFLRGTSTWLQFNSAGSGHIWEITGTEKMRLDSNGDLGIGTTSPDNQLHLYKASGDPTLEIEAVSGGDPTILLTSANNREGIINFADGSTNSSFRYDHDNTRFEMMCHNGSTVDHTFMEESLHLGVNDADFRIVFSSKGGQYSAGSSNAFHNLRGHGTGINLNVATVTDVMAFEFGGNPRYAMNTGSLYPTANNAYDLGSPSNRWANVYAGDLHLKNEQGDWTVEEGEEELYIYNNKTGKKYAFVLREIE